MLRKGHNASYQKQLEFGSEIYCHPEYYLPFETEIKRNVTMLNKNFQGNYFLWKNDNF